MIPVEQCLEMAQICKEMGRKYDISLNDQLGHNDLATLSDLCLPIMKFLKNMGIDIKNDVKYIMNMPEETAWKLKGNNGVGDKRKNSLMKMLMEKTLKEV